MELSKLRRRRGISQQQVADSLGISQAAVARWDAGLASPSAERLPKLAALFGCTIDELFDADAKRCDAADAVSCR